MLPIRSAVHFVLVLVLSLFITTLVGCGPKDEQDDSDQSVILPEHYTKKTVEMKNGNVTVTYVVVQKEEKVEPVTECKNCQAKVTTADLKIPNTFQAKDGTIVYREPTKEEKKPDDGVPAGCELRRDKQGNVYLVTPKGVDPNDPKFWGFGDKMFCKDCWKEKK